MMAKNFLVDSLCDALGKRLSELLEGKKSAANTHGGANPIHSSLEESAENIALVNSMLKAIPASCSRDEWHKAVGGLLDTNWSCAIAMAHEWSASCPDKYDEVDLNNFINWYSHDEDNRYRFGSLKYLARKYGWEDSQAPGDDCKFDIHDSDIYAGKHFSKMHKDNLLFIPELDTWFNFKPDTGWVPAPYKEEVRRASQTVREFRKIAAEKYTSTDSEDANATKAFKFANRYGKHQNLVSMIQMAKAEPGMSRSINQFDSNPMLLGVQNGVLDLTSQLLLPMSPDIFVSKRCNATFDPSAKCPRFLKFLSEVQPAIDNANFVQRWIGYNLTGLVDEQKLLFLFGEGANGKSVLAELMAWLMGDYTRKIATEMLMQHQRNPQGPSPDIVALKGARFVFANETEEGKYLNASRVKDLTGGDTLTGRMPYGKVDLMFWPTHKLWIIGNHKPDISDNSHGMWRRILLANFNVTISEDNRDPKLLEKLKGEASGILNWALEGLRMYLASGLQVPANIQAATDCYRDEQDILGEWLQHHCSIASDKKVLKQPLYSAYRAYCADNGHRPLSKTKLTRRLNERGFHPLSDKRSISGLDLNAVGLLDSHRSF